MAHSPKSPTSHGIRIHKTIPEEGAPQNESPKPNMARKPSVSWQKAVKFATSNGNKSEPPRTETISAPPPSNRRASVHVDTFRRSSMERNTHISERRGSLFRRGFNLHDAAKMSLRKKNESEEEKKRLQKQLKDLQESHDELQEELEDMRKSYNSLQEKSSGAQAQYERTVKMLDKIRADNKGKLMELSKLRQELQTLGDRMRTLENKAMEVEKLEIAVETLKKSLESTQLEVRERERELRIVKDDLAKTEKKLDESEKASVNIKKKNDDLRQQVREELNRNTQLELRIENADSLKETIEEQKAEIDETKRFAEEKSLIAQHARKCLRDEREKKKELEDKINDAEKISDEVYLVRSENQTLKSLMVAKDKMIVQKTQIISNLMNALQSLPPEEPYLTLIRILENKDTVPATFANGVASDDEDRPSRPKTAPVNDSNRNSRNRSRHPHKSPSKPREAFENDDRSDCSSQYKTSFFLTALDTDREGNKSYETNGFSEGHNRESSRSPSRKSGGSRSSRASRKIGLNRPQMARETLFDFRSDLGSFSDVSVHSFQESEAGNQNRSNSKQSNPIHQSNSSIDSQAETIDEASRAYTEEEDRQDTAINIHVQHKPVRATRSVKVGDRVLVNLSKKKDKKKNLQQGVIRYLGDFDGLYGPYKIYIGLKLDEPLGDTEGIIMNKRFFRSPPRFGKILPLNKIVSLYDKEAGLFRRVESVTSEYILQDEQSFSESNINNDTLRTNGHSPTPNKVTYAI